MNPATRKNWEPFFNPKSIVIIGASRNKYTFNGIVVKNLLEAQYKGKIYLIHPYTDKILGIPCYPSLKKLEKIEKKPELAIILTQNKMLKNLELLGKMGIKHVLIETDVSLNIPEKRWNQLREKYQSIINTFDMHVLGPSMIGIIDFQHSFTTSVIPTRSHILQPFDRKKEKAGISFLAQSGGLSGGLGWWHPIQNIPFAKVIHIGKAMNITEAEILEYLFKDPATKIIILYLKKIKPDLIKIMEEKNGKKPVLFKYAGKDLELEKEFEMAGAIKVDHYIELFEFAKLFLWCPPPKINAAGIIGPSAGAINLLISEMRKLDIHLASLKNNNKEKILDAIGGSTCALGNPVDYWPPKEFVGTEVCRIYNRASDILLRDENVGILLLALEFFNEIEFNFSIFEQLKKKYPEKPIICVLIQAERGGQKRILEIADKLKIPVFVNEPERAIRGVRSLLQYYNKIDK